MYGFIVSIVPPGDLASNDVSSNVYGTRIWNANFWGSGVAVQFLYSMLYNTTYLPSIVTNAIVGLKYIVIRIR